jgi:hypothetical protein
MEKGFFASLFDFNFETYITKRVASVMYAVLTALVLLTTLVVFIYSITLLGNSYVAGQALLMLIITPIFGLLALTTIRVGFETSIALVAIAQNTKK